jgi:delta 1-pyrroline-5-carboxylate dehydrogenase
VRTGGGARWRDRVGAGLRPRRNLLLERLYIERSLSVNTAAAGGNASLMTIG